MLRSFRFWRLIHIYNFIYDHEGTDYLILHIKVKFNKWTADPHSPPPNLMSYPDYYVISKCMYNIISYCLPRSFKVRSDGAIGLPIYYFLLVFNSNLSYGVTQVLYEV